MERNIYKNLYSDRKNLGNLADSLRVRKMAAIIDGIKCENKNILDIGCYDGAFLSLLKYRKNNFFGLEASDWAIEQAWRKEIDTQQYFFDDKAKLPYEDGFFDIVVAGEIIEHIFDTDFFLAEIRRTLKPGGRLLISTPNLASLGRRLLIFFGFNPIIELSPNEPESSGHIRYFTFKTLERLLEKHKFKIISVQSDCVNFSKNGKIKSTLLAKIYPTLGASIICYAKKYS